MISARVYQRLLKEAMRLNLGASAVAIANFDKDQIPETHVAGR